MVEEKLKDKEPKIVNEEELNGEVNHNKEEEINNEKDQENA